MRPQIVNDILTAWRPFPLWRLLLRLLGRGLPTLRPLLRLLLGLLLRHWRLPALRLGLLRWRIYSGLLLCSAALGYLLLLGLLLRRCAARRHLLRGLTSLRLLLNGRPAIGDSTISVSRCLLLAQCLLFCPIPRDARRYWVFGRCCCLLLRLCLLGLIVFVGQIVPFRGRYRVALL